MKKKKLFIAVLLGGVIGSAAAFAQEADTLHSWQKGPLQWSEYRGFGSAQEDTARSVIKLKKTTGKERDGYKRYFYPVVKATFYPEYSFVSESKKTNDELNQQQLLFDYKELFARAYRDSLMLGVSDTKYTQELFSRRAETAFKEKWLTPSELKAALAEDRFNPKSFQWEETYGFFAQVGLDDRIFARTFSGIHPWTESFLLSGGYHKNRFSASFDIVLWFFGKPLFARSNHKTFQFSSQSLAFGYSFYKTERFAFSALLGAGYGLLSSAKEYENAFVKEALQADYTLFSYYITNNGKPERADIQLFVRIGSDQMILSDGIIPCGLLDIGFRGKITYLKLKK